MPALEAAQPTAAARGVPPAPTSHPAATLASSPVDLGAGQLAKGGDAWEGNLVDDQQQGDAHRHDDANLNSLQRSDEEGGKCSWQVRLGM